MLLACFSTWVMLCSIANLQVTRGQGFAPAGFINEKCFDCLCEASSGCKLDIGCDNFGPGQYFCGPFQISFTYWQDAGSPGSDLNNPLDFEMCLNNRNCAEATIRGYMGKWLRDCDNNEAVDCYDVAKTHMGGPEGCNGTWLLRTNFWSKFQSCYRQ